MPQILQKERILLLNGKWKFHYTDNFNERPMDGFYEENFNDKSWSDINVPGNWEIHDSESLFT